MYLGTVRIRLNVLTERFIVKKIACSNFVALCHIAIPPVRAAHAQVEAGRTVSEAQTQRDGELQ